MAKECDQPRNPDTVVCRNCEKMGHFSRDCTEPKDWSKHKCSNCGELGHGPKVSIPPVGEGIHANLNSVARLRLLIPMTIPVVILVVAGVEIRVTLLLLLLLVKLLGMTVVMEVGRLMPRHRLFRNNIPVGVSRAGYGQRWLMWT